MESGWQGEKGIKGIESARRGISRMDHFIVSAVLDDRHQWGWEWGRHVMWG